MKNHNFQEYHSALTALLPRGLAWNRNNNSILSKLLLANAFELERIDNNANLLLTEINPATTINSLADWERILDLPDACLPAGTTFQERKDAVLSKLQDSGRQDLAYYYEQAKTLGYDITIQEFWPTMCGWHECMNIQGLAEKEIQKYKAIAFLGYETVRYWVNVIVNGNRIIYARCAETELPDYILDWRSATSLECVFRRDFLAHILITFEYQ